MTPTSSRRSLWAAAPAARDPTIGVLVEVDVGMHRGGVRSIEQARSLAAAVDGARGCGCAA